MLLSLSSDVEQLLIACAATEVDNLASQLVIILGSALFKISLILNETYFSRESILTRLDDRLGTKYSSLHQQFQTGSYLIVGGRWIISAHFHITSNLNISRRVPAWATQGHISLCLYFPAVSTVCVRRPFFFTTRLTNTALGRPQCISKLSGPNTVSLYYLLGTTCFTHVQNTTVTVTHSFACLF
jgi:hypothetical protein